VRSTTEELYKTGVPFARKYTECLSLLSTVPVEVCNQNDGRITRLQQIQFESISFSYDNAPADTEDEESISSCEQGIGDDSDEFEESSAQDTKPDMRKALCDFTFHFEAGKVYSIVGKNGSGKSTLVNILGKLYEPSEGQVLVNGIPLSNVPETTWTQNLVMVAQDQSFIWNGTVRDNIAFGLRNDQYSAVEDEAEACGVTEFVTTEAFLGDKERSLSLPGVELERWVDNFSGGQWKSIALARAFCRKATASLFILDEPSAALDPQKEYELFERLRREREGRITIFISHRLQTCRASDCILVMDGGRLVQSGSHKDLIKDESGIYAELNRLQNEDWQDI
jgi:ATP-binding cassette subfamily B protein